MSEKISLFGEEGRAQAWSSSSPMYPSTGTRQGLTSDASSSVIPLTSATSVEHTSRPVTGTLHSPAHITSSYATGGILSLSSPKLNCPTAKVAPMVEHTPSRRARLHDRTHSPDLTRHTGSSNWDGDEEKRRLKQAVAGKSLRDTYSPSRRTDLSSENIKSLMNSLSDKSQIIERQKQTISRLQQECREKDTQLLLMRGAEGIIATPTSIKTDLPEGQSSSHKIDSLYYELQENKKQIIILTNELSSKQLTIDGLQQGKRELSEANRELKHKIEKLNDYLGDTPTMEEYHSLQHQLSELQSQCGSLSSEATTKEEKLTSVRGLLEDKERVLSECHSNITGLSTANEELRHQVATQEQRILELHSDNSKLKKDIHKLQKAVNEGDSRCQQELRSMRERHKQRFEMATAKLRNQFKNLQKKNKSMEAQLQKSSDMMTALNNELRFSHGTIGDLKSSITDLVAQNQTLVEQNVSLKESNYQPQRGESPPPSASAARPDDGNHQVAQQLAACVDEFDSIVQLVNSVLEGRDPNISKLLGTADSSPSTSFSSASALEGSTEKKLAQLRRLQQEIDRLRSVVVDHYASQVATKCAVQ